MFRHMKSWHVCESCKIKLSQDRETKQRQDLMLARLNISKGYIVYRVNAEDRHAARYFTSSHSNVLHQCTPSMGTRKKRVQIRKTIKSVTMGCVLMGEKRCCTVLDCRIGKYEMSCSMMSGDVAVAFNESRGA